MNVALYLAALFCDAPDFVKNEIFSKSGINPSVHDDVIKQAEEIVKGGSNEEQKTIRLQSAFINIVNDKYTSANAECTKKPDTIIQPHYYTPQKLALSDNFFPSSEYVGEDGLIEVAKKLWEDFLGETQELQLGEDKLNYAETLLNLLHKYTIALPNKSGYLPDVSFYDYAKMTAAMALCLAETDNSEKPLLLVKADMSGIQGYIYEIVSKNAAKSLKGRSFYVQLLSDSILHYLLKKLDLPQANIVYNSGGNFLLLAPNSKQNQEKITQAEQYITKQLFTAHKTSIAVIIDFVKVSAIQLVNGTHEITKELAEKIEERKKRKFVNKIKGDYKNFFEPIDVKIADAITGEDIEEDDIREMNNFRYDPIFQKDGDKEPDFNYDEIKLLTFQQICLGRRLKGANYLVVSFAELRVGNNREYLINPAMLGVYFYLVEDKGDLEKLLTENKDFYLQVLSLNDFDFVQQQSNPKHQYGFMLYGGNETPIFEYIYWDEEERQYLGSKESNKMKTFSHLTLRLGYSEREKDIVNLATIKRLGVLMLDVDGLGNVFKCTNFPSFATYAAFSRHLDYFFLGYLNVLWKNNSQFQHNTQIIYAGGDDVFIVGRWDLIVLFAELIQKALLNWSCQNQIGHDPKVSVSGGIAIVTHKFPIMKAAEIAMYAEKEAKAHKYNEMSKNAISLWGKPLNWEVEYKIVKELKQQIDKFIGDDKSSIFRNLQEYYFEHISLEGKGLSEEKNQKNGNTTNYIKELEKNNSTEMETQKRYAWKYSYQIRWRVAYYITKTQGRYRSKNPDFYNLLEGIKLGVFANAYKDAVLNGNYSYFDLLNLAIRWAELEKRTNN